MTITEEIDDAVRAWQQAAPIRDRLPRWLFLGIKKRRALHRWMLTQPTRFNIETIGITSYKSMSVRTVLGDEDEIIVAR